MTYKNEILLHMCNCAVCLSTLKPVFKMEAVISVKDE